MIGFTFNGTHSGSAGCWMLSTDRTVRPEKRVYAYSIPGRSGTVKLEDDTWEDRLIRLRLSFTGASLTRESLRQKVRSVAGWLSGSGNLSFDDEPGVYYKATVQSGISLDQVSVTGSCEVIFLCDPFAYAAVPTTLLVQGAAIRSTGDAQAVCTTTGTVETDCVIIVKALSAISALSVIRAGRGASFAALDMAANSVLAIDTAAMTAILDGDNALHLLSDDSDLSWLRLQPGTNDIYFRGTSSTADIRIEWRDRWL